MGKKIRGDTQYNNEKPVSYWKFLKFTAPYCWNGINCCQRLILLSSLTLLVVYNLLKLLATIVLKSIVDQLAVGDVNYYYIGAFCLLEFFIEICNSLKTLSFVFVESKLQTELAAKVFNHVLNLSMKFHIARETGKILRCLQRGATSVPLVLRTLLFSFGPVILQIMFVMTYLSLKYELYYPMIVLGTVIIYIIFTIFASEWRSQIQRNINANDNKFSQKATDALFNFETVKYFNAEDHETKRCSAAFYEFRKEKVRMHASLVLLNTGQQVCIILGTSIALCLIAYEIYLGNKKVGDFVLMQGFISQIYTPLQAIGVYYDTIKQAIIDIEGVFGLLNEKLEIEDKQNAVKLDHCKGEIEFKNVDFGYSLEYPLVLKNINFKLSPGKTIGIVGKTGCGKSTLVRLLYRFYDVTNGSILLDGYDIKTLSQSSLRRHIAIVPQDCSLFNDTLGYNIAYGSAWDPKFDMNSKHTIDKIKWSAHQAQLDSFTEKLHEGYQTMVGEKGIRLSGGERQRVAIARAILKQPSILCFDEATSSLDSLTEKQIQNSLDMVSRNRTTIIIAHRLSTIMKADEIIVLKDGCIIERGTHKLLLEINGYYAQLWAEQERECTNEDNN
ncbi:unnamed protein product [Blepharisma stoltei]|uniref:Uncharacterized protein n=1 Tax=Blepharisma stoltei TaxID=1481888 RepID=A0AAU9J9D3_9CILI|nr:unnamed protein product [Blepharisma stoltei]